MVRDATFSLEVDELVFHSVAASCHRTLGFPTNEPTKVLERNVVPDNESLGCLREECFDLLIAMLCRDLAEALHTNKEVTTSLDIRTLVHGRMKARGESQRMTTEVITLQTRGMRKIHKSLRLHWNAELLGNKINRQAESSVSATKFDKGGIRRCLLENVLRLLELQNRSRRHRNSVDIRLERVSNAIIELSELADVIVGKRALLHEEILKLEPLFGRAMLQHLAVIGMRLEVIDGARRNKIGIPSLELLHHLCVCSESESVQISAPLQSYPQSSQPPA